MSAWAHTRWLQNFNCLINTAYPETSRAVNSMFLNTPAANNLSKIQEKLAIQKNHTRARKSTC